MGYYIGGALLVCFLLGLLTERIAAKKGYKNGFAWGFLLNVIGLAIVLLRSKSPYAPAASEPTPVGEYPGGGLGPGLATWTCSCGAHNAVDATSCPSCGLDNPRLGQTKEKGATHAVMEAQVMSFLRSRQR